MPIVTEAGHTTYSHYFYRIKETSPLYKPMKAYHDRCRNFVAHAEWLVGRYEADSAVKARTDSGITIKALNFMQNVPFWWRMGADGSFFPNPNKRAAQYFRLEVPHFSKLYPEAPKDIRFTNYGNKIFACLKAKEDSGVTEIEGADVLIGNDLMQLKLLTFPSPAESEYFENILAPMGRDPEPIATAKVFKPSQEIIDLNGLRQARGINDVSNYRESLRKRPWMYPLVPLCMPL